MNAKRPPSGREPNPERVREAMRGLAEAMGTVMPIPEPADYGEAMVQRARDGRDAPEANEDRLPKHVREWLAEKNKNDLKNIDATVELIVSSRLAGKVLFWIGGTAVTVILGAWGLAKAGIDAFALFRGGIK